VKKITVGIIATVRETVDALKVQIAHTGAATVVAEVSGVATETNWSARKVIDADPQIIIVDISDAETSLPTLQFLHAAAPNARLLATSSNTDPQLMIELMRAGVREFLPSPVSEQALLQAFNRYTSDTARAAHEKKRVTRGKVYCIASAKHGSGATTIAINLAATIVSRSRQSTALIDFDRPLGDVAAYLNVKPNFTVTDALAAGSRLDSVLLESYMQPSHGFHILPGFPEHSADSSLSADKMAQLLEIAQSTFEHTIVDLPTNLDEDQVKVITRCSSTILVILTPELPAIWRTERLLSYLTRLHAAEKVRIVLNRATRSDDISDADIERLLRMPLY